ncbi:MAG: ABC transporter ATP-binding protein [Verrucomicrobiota bacterium]
MIPREMILEQRNQLVIRDISKSFGNTRVLSRVRAIVPAGKITAFIGPNGAGKTTLFHIISGVLSPDAGRIVYSGQEINELKPHTLARMGMVRQFQDIRPFKALSVFENTLIATLPYSAHSLGFRSLRACKSRETEKKALACLEEVGLIDKKDQLAKELSHGQQKLLSLARLLACDARLFLLDEPTAGLSLPMIEKVVAIIHRAVDLHGVTVALIEHNMSVVGDLAHWIHFMNEGCVAFSGLSNHVLDNQNVRQIYMGL